MSHNIVDKINKLDVVDPPILKIEGRCYRNLQISDDIVPISNQLYHPQVEQSICEYEDVDIFKGSNGQYQLSLTIPKISHHKIIGHLGKTLSKLKSDSGCEIYVPILREESENVLISGPTTRAVKSVKNRIEIILSFPSKNDIPEVTHFISIPISSFQIVDSFGEFKHHVIERSARGIDETIFQDPNRLHLTVCALILQSKEEISKALELFSTQVYLLLENYISKGTSIELRGTECMNDDPSDVHVLYARAELVGGKTTLQTLCDKICKPYEELGFSEVRKGRMGAKIHVTLMNSKKRFVNVSGRIDPHQRSQRISFDAGYALKKYDCQYLFGRSPLTEVHLSDINNIDPLTGYYQSINIINC